MSTSDNRCGVNHQWGSDFEVALLPGFDIQHPGDQRALQSSTRSNQKMESRSGEFDPPLEVNDPKLLAQLPMRLRFERSKLCRSSFAMHDDVGALAGADRNIILWQIRKT